MNLKREVSERDIQLFFDTAGKLLEAAESDGAKARAAIAALEQFHQQVDARLRHLSEEVARKIDAAAERTADKAAKLLQERFREADAEADRAAERYRQAASSLTKRQWMMGYGLLVGVLALLAIFGFAMVPSLDEIQQRRAELNALNTEIQDKRVRWGMCIEGRKRRPCIQTDERAWNGEPYRSEGGSTWRAPMRN